MMLLCLEGSIQKKKKRSENCITVICSSCTGQLQGVWESAKQKASSFTWFSVPNIAKDKIYQFSAVQQ
jgi:hypothetical protein